MWITDQASSASLALSETLTGYQMTLEVVKSVWVLRVSSGEPPSWQQQPHTAEARRKWSFL